jgi:hypothetical protein
MINRKAFWITILLVLAMIAANIWRASLLPDWRHVPAEVAGNIRVIPVFWTFLPPLEVLFMMGMFFALGWFIRSAPEEAAQAWRLYQGRALVFVAGIATLAQAYSLAHSLGALQSVDPPTFRHVIFVAAGIFMMVAGNILPKMPWLTTRFRPLDPWQWNQHLRFAGKLTFAFGLFYAVGMPLLPFKIVVPLGIGLPLTIMAASFWHRAKVRREPSPQS